MALAQEKSKDINFVLKNLLAGGKSITIRVYARDYHLSGRNINRRVNVIETYILISASLHPHLIRSLINHARQKALTLIRYASDDAYTRNCRNFCVNFFSNTRQKTMTKRKRRKCMRKIHEKPVH